MTEKKLTEYSLPPLQYSESGVTASKEPSLITSDNLSVDFNTEFSPSLSYYQGRFFMAISYKVNGLEQHQRVPMDALQVAHLVSQGAKALAAHVNYDLKKGVSE